MDETQINPRNEADTPNRSGSGKGDRNCEIDKKKGSNNSGDGKGRIESEPFIRTHGKGKGIMNQSTKTRKWSEGASEWSREASGLSLDGIRHISFRNNRLWRNLVQLALKNEELARALNVVKGRNEESALILAIFAFEELGKAKRIIETKGGVCQKS